jgi:hypothetical protein
MNSISDPGTMMLIHNEKVRQAMERGRREQRRWNDTPRLVDRNGPDRRLRLAISHGLVALARRIAPAEPTADSGLPAAARH